MALHNLMKRLFSDVIYNRLWSFGPREVGPNMLISSIPGHKCTSTWRREKTGNKAGEDMTEVKSMKDFEASVETGFQLATAAGPLCAEPMSGVAFILEEFALSLEDADSKTNAILHFF